MTKLQDYYDMLSKHDWYYYFSDDQRVFYKGDKIETTLNEVAKESPEHAQLFLDFKEHYFSGSAFKTDKKPLPRRPE